MPDISITVTDKRPVCTAGTTVVCDNSDYIVHWDLDEEWNAYDTKTMRVIYMDSTYADTVFSGDSVALPPVPVPGCVQIGLYAGDIHTSRMALLRALSSVRSASGAPANPTPDVYDQLMERMSQLENPDWNQNDPTAKDYIKNRTHYVSQENKVIAPEQEVTTAVQNNFNIAILNGVDFDTFKTLFNSEDNTTFDVVFDGASYPCKWLEQNGVRIPVFGNLAITDSSLTDTGEPFCTSLGEEPGARDILAIACKVAGTHTVAVNYPQDVVHTINPKYIGHIEPGMIGDISDGILTINHMTEFAKGSWASDYSYFKDNWLPTNFGADISLEINGKLFEHLPFSSGPYGSFSYGDVSTIGVAIVNSGRGSPTQSVNVSKVMFPDGVTSAKVYRTVPLRIPDGAVPEKAEWVLNHSAEDFVGNQDAAFVRRFGTIQVAKPNRSDSDVVFNQRRHSMLLISTPSGESYYDTKGKNTITCNNGTTTYTEFDVHLSDGSIVTSSDWPLGCALIGTDFADDLYLLNPRVTK